MRNLTRLAHLLIADVESGAKQYRQLFKQTLNIDYVDLAFKEYETQLRQSSRSLIKLVIHTIDENPLIQHLSFTNGHWERRIHRIYCVNFKSNFQFIIGLGF